MGEKKTKETRPHVLVGCVTYVKQAPVLDLLMGSLKRMQGKGKDFDVDFLFVDNSPGQEYYQHLQKKLGAAGLPGKVMVAYDSPHLKNRIDRIISGRNAVRDVFLKNGYTHLFFLDTDVIIPPNALTMLLNHGKPLIAGAYLSRLQMPDGKTGVFPVACVPHDTPGRVRQLKIEDVWQPRLLELAITGLGCVLIQRGVLEKISFRNITDSTTGGEDTAFYRDARTAGFPLFMDTSVKCDHYFYPPGDGRNAFCLFSRYRKRDDPVEVGYSFGINAEK